VVDWSMRASSLPTQESITQHARDLIDAQAGGHRLDPDNLRMTVEQGYAVQRDGRSVRVAAGERLVGYKIGLTSSSSREPYAMSEPVSGYLLESTIADRSANYSLAGLSNPRVEAEIAFILSASIGGEDTTDDEVIAATSEVAVALEIVASRWSGGAPSAGHLVADNVSAAGVVLGPRSTPSGSTFEDISVVVQMGDVTVLGEGKNVFEHPAKSVAWLVSHLARTNQQLAAGDIVMSGSFITPLPVTAGDSLVADYGPLGQITVAFTD
jgi:2-keto-4-pentenoate hydratase